MSLLRNWQKLEHLQNCKADFHTYTKAKIASFNSRWKKTWFVNVGKSL